MWKVKFTGSSLEFTSGAEFVRIYLEGNCEREVSEPGRYEVDGLEEEMEKFLVELFGREKLDDRWASLDPVDVGFKLKFDVGNYGCVLVFPTSFAKDGFWLILELVNFCGIISFGRDEIKVVLEGVEFYGRAKYNFHTLKKLLDDNRIVAFSYDLNLGVVGDKLVMKSGKGNVVFEIGPEKYRKRYAFIYGVDLEGGVLLKWLETVLRLYSSEAKKDVDGNKVGVGNIWYFVSRDSPVVCLADYNNLKLVVYTDRALIMRGEHIQIGCRFDAELTKYAMWIKSFALDVFNSSRF